MVEIGRDFITEEEGVLKRQDHSIDGFVAKTVKGGNNHVMRVSWLKRGLFIRDGGVIQDEEAFFLE